MTDRERRGAKLGVGERRAAVAGLGVLAWLVALLWIFPFAWTVFTSFKTEQDAAAQTLHQGLSFGRYSDVSHSTSGTLSLQSAFTNSLVVVVVSTLIVLALALRLRTLSRSALFTDGATSSSSSSRPSSCRSSPRSSRSTSMRRNGT